MSVIIVWLLVTTNAYGTFYSPSLADLQTCEFLQKNAPRHTNNYSRCIQVNIVK